MMERSNNTLTANEIRNDRDMIDSDTTFIENPTAQDEGLVVDRTSRSMTRRKLGIIISVAIAIGVIILVILIPVLGLRKSA